jgi:transposase-like protein
VNDKMRAAIVLAYAAGAGSVAVGVSLGISYQTVLRELKRAGVAIRHHGGPGGHRERVSAAGAMRIANLYYRVLDGRRLTVAAVARRCGVTPGAVYSTLRRLNPGLRPSRQRGRQTIVLPVVEVTALLAGYRSGRSLQDLARLHGVSTSVVMRCLIAAGQPRRPAGRPRKSLVTS